MIPEPMNTVFVIFVCLSVALYVGGYLPVSNKSPSVEWLKARNPIYPKALSAIFVFIALSKALVFLF
tara:strand:- start:477 stop:677 length:201 start_codon:yes stop_codon:yes gene_type:complete